MKPLKRRKRPKPTKTKKCPYIPWHCGKQMIQVGRIFDLKGHSFWRKEKYYYKNKRFYLLCSDCNKLLIVGVDNEFKS